MTTNAKIGYGNLFQLWDSVTSPNAYTTIAEVSKITPPAMKRDAQDATHTESANTYREFIKGLKDGGEVTVELNFVPDSNTTDLLIQEFETDLLNHARILFADGDQAASPPTCSTFVMSGVITALSFEGPIDDKMTATLTFKISGKPVFTRSLL